MGSQGLGVLLLLGAGRRGVRQRVRRAPAPAGIALRDLYKPAPAGGKNPLRLVPQRIPLRQPRRGEAHGPYEPTTDFPLTNYIDAKIYEENDTLWFIWQHGMMGRLNDQMDGLTEIVNVYEAGGFDPEPCREGVHIFKHDSRYYLVQSIWTHRIDGRTTYCHRGHQEGPAVSYDAVIASSDHLHGPYGARRTLITGGGHGNPFQDKDGNWWCCIFVCRNDKLAQSRVSFVERPALVPMRWQDGQLVVSQNIGHGI